MNTCICSLANIFLCRVYFVEIDEKLKFALCLKWFYFHLNQIKRIFNKSKRFYINVFENIYII